MDRHIDAYALDCIKRWEGLRLAAYQDVAGVWTIGYGHTGSVSEGMTITEAEAETLLRSDLAPCELAVERAVAAPLSDGQFGALVSFVFNVGASAFQGSTLLRRLNSGDYAAVPAELARWNKARDPSTGALVPVPGLTNRRAAEAGLWARGDYVNTNTAPVEPPPAPAPLYRTPQGIGAGATGLGAAGGVLQSTAQSLQITGASSPWLSAVVALLVLAGAGLVVYGLIRQSRAQP